MRRISILFFALMLNMSVHSVFADEILLGEFPAEITPEQARVIPLKETGPVTELIDVSGRIPRDTIIACVNREEIEQKERETELKLLRDAVSKKDDIRKLEEQKAELKFYLSLPLSQRKYETTVSDKKLTKESLKDLEERINLAQRELVSSEKREQMNLKKLRDQYIIRMPFDGRVQYHFTLPEDPNQPLELEGGQPFITVCNDSAFYINIALSQSDMTQLPAEKMHVRVSLSEGKSLSGVFAHRRVETDRSGSNTRLIYSFRVPQNDHDLAYSLVSSKCIAKVYYEVDGEILRVPKNELTLNPMALRATSWSQLAETVYPDYVVVVVAADAVILRKK